MNFINNYSQPIQLAAGVTSVALSLPDGEYVLTLADSATAPTRHEIVSAALAGGTATLVRGQEGTADQLWPMGSIIYCAVTAGLLAGIFQRLPEPGAVSGILTRLDALEASGGGGATPDNQITILTGSGGQGDFSFRGYDDVDAVGSIVALPGMFAGASGITLEAMRTGAGPVAGSPVYDMTIYGKSTALAPAAAYLIEGPNIPTGTTADIFSEDVGGGLFSWSLYVDFGATEVMWPDATEITLTISPVAQS